MPTTMTSRHIDDVEARRGKSTAATQRDKFLAADLICEIKVAVREADADDFASDAEVAELAEKWKLNAGS